MGKVREPKVLWVDACFHGSPELKVLEDQGHVINCMDMSSIDLIISPKAQMTPPGRLGYVAKKLKDIVKEVAK